MANRKWYDVTWKRSIGSCILKASVDQVLVDTIGQYGNQHLVDMSAETPLSAGRHVVLVNRTSVDTTGRYVGRHLGRYVAIDSC